MQENLPPVRVLKRDGEFEGDAENRLEDRGVGGRGLTKGRSRLSCLVLRTERIRMHLSLSDVLGGRKSLIPRAV